MVHKGEPSAIKVIPGGVLRVLPYAGFYALQVRAKVESGDTFLVNGTMPTKTRLVVWAVR